jgi:RNA polymerase sigma-70 factor (ECF subfamily)
MDGRQQESQAPPGPWGSTRPADAPLVELWHQSRRWLAAILYAHKPRDVDLEDLMQDVATRLVKHRDELADPRDPAAVRPWLRTVAINVARSAGRRSRTRAGAMPVLEYHAAIRSRDEANGAHVAGETSRVRGRRALGMAMTLPPTYREPLLLSLRGLSQRQIAQVMDLPVTTVETRLIRARRMVRDELEREEVQSQEVQKGEMNEVLS